MSSQSDNDVDQKIKTTKKQIVEIMTYLEGLKSMTDDLVLSRHIFPSIFHHISNIYKEVLKADPATLDATTSYVRQKLQARGDVYHPPMYAFRRKSKKSTRKGKKSMRKTKRSARK